MSAATDPPGPDEAALAAAFAGSAPEGSLPWLLNGALDRLEDADGADVAWGGVPDDVWHRGRAARVGERLAGEALDALAGALAADTRRVTAAQRTRTDRRFDAVLDALRVVAARLDQFERVAGPVPDAAVAAVVPPPDVAPWAERLAGWFGPVPPTGSRRILVGEAGAGAMARILGTSGWEVSGVEPRAPLVWAAFGDGVDGTVVGDVADHLPRYGRGDLAGLVLAGIVDRAPLATAVGLVSVAATAVRSGGVAVVLTTDRAAWEGSASPVARDLAPGRPLHPETWVALLDRAGFEPAVWHRPPTGHVHAVVARRP